MASPATFLEISIPGSSDWLKVMANFAGGVTSLLAGQCDGGDLQQYVLIATDSRCVSYRIDWFGAAGSA
ncbi:MAG: hypothetical protein JSR71_14545 [Proteobacteria bacterium]|nr:hypothetical protein [Pseudomonadota bacterium]